MPDVESENFARRFIIPPNSYGSMLWNNFIVLVFVVYMLICALFISYSFKLSSKQINILFIFDIMFLIDRTIDMFIGYEYDGRLEKKIGKVLARNFEQKKDKLFQELFISIGPILFNVKQYNSLVYAFFKLPRYFRMFEMDS